MIIHKTKTTKYADLTPTKCGIKVRYRKSSYHWKDVTCKNCLKQKKEKSK